MTKENDIPAAHWREFGDKDPHGSKYECRRSDLPYGGFTDDQIANAVFTCDHRTSLASIGLLEAAKERIRWLSRQNEAKAARIAQLEKAASNTETFLEGIRGDIEAGISEAKNMGPDWLDSGPADVIAPLDRALAEIEAKQTRFRMRNGDLTTFTLFKMPPEKAIDPVKNTTPRESNGGSGDLLDYARKIDEALSLCADKLTKAEALITAAEELLHEWDAFGCLTVENPSGKTVMRKFRDALTKAKETAQ